MQIFGRYGIPEIIRSDRQGQTDKVRQWTTIYE